MKWLFITLLVLAISELSACQSQNSGWSDASESDLAGEFSDLDNLNEGSDFQPTSFGAIVWARGDSVGGYVRPDPSGAPCRVQFLINGEPMGERLADQYSAKACVEINACESGFALKLPRLVPGTYSLDVARIDHQGNASPLDGSPVEIRVIDPMDPDPARLLAYDLPDAGLADDLTEWMRRHLDIDSLTGIGFPVCQKDYQAPEPGMSTWGLVPGAEIQGLYWTYPDEILMRFIDREALGNRRYQCGALTNNRFGIWFEPLWPIDRFGLAWWDRYQVVPDNAGPDDFIAGQGLAFPHYGQFAHCVGWEFNCLDGDLKNDGCAKDSDDPIQSWEAVSGGLDTAPDILVISGSNRGAEIWSGPIDLSSEQAPFVEIQVRADDIQDLNGLTLSWEGESSGSMSIDKATTPVDRYPELFTQGTARLFFPLYLDPGYSGRLSRLGLLFPSLQANHTVYLNYLRPSFDTRWPVGNALFILSARSIIGNAEDSKEILSQSLTRLRRLAGFILLHQVKAGRLTFEFFRGFDGLGDVVGKSMAGSYFDMYPMGRADIPALSINAAALEAMAEMEDWAQDLGIELPPPSIDSAAGIPTPCPVDPRLYRDNARSLRNQLAELWNVETGRLAFNRDAEGNLHDLGNLHHNLEAIVLGGLDNQMADSILDWVLGKRAVENDNSQGSDIYFYQFAPRARTVDDSLQFNWVWSRMVRQFSQMRLFRFGNQILNGGAVPLSTYYELLSLARRGRTEELWARILQIDSWCQSITKAGGQGRAFYRAYYTENPFDDPYGEDPERGFLQGCVGKQVYPGGPTGTAGAIGLDCEFISDAGIMTIAPLQALLGLEIERHDTLRIDPRWPEKVEWVGAKKLWFKGNRLAIRAEPDGTLDLSGSEIFYSSLHILYLLDRPGSLQREDGQTFDLVPDDQGRFQVLLPLVEAKYQFLNPKQIPSLVSKTKYRVDGGKRMRATTSPNEKCNKILVPNLLRDSCQ